MMTADKPSNLVPELRFLEFRDAGHWMTKILGDQGRFLSSLTGKTAKDFDTGNAAFIPYMNVFSNTFTNIFDLRSVNVGSDESQNAVAKGDVFFTVSSETPEDAGMSSVLLEEIENCYLNSFCALFRFDDGKLPNLVFLGSLFRSALARAHLARGAQGATRYNIPRATFRSLPLHLPRAPEQQKIADCLGSLDDLIAAEGRKLEALRQHKLGLMQHLFPQPGETAPRLRFPEFRNAAEWRKYALGEIAEISKGKGISKSDVVEDGQTPCVRYGELYTSYDEIIEIVKSRTNLPASDLVLSNAGDLIIPASGETKEDIATCACVIDAGVALGSDLNVIRSPVDGRFFSYYLNGSRRRELAKVAQGVTVAHLYPNQLSRLQIHIPDAKPEQQKIAACLGALDDLIAAQGRKIEALRQHKKGLMQQVFPSLECH